MCFGGREGIGPTRLKCSKNNHGVVALVETRRGQHLKVSKSAGDLHDFTVFQNGYSAAYNGTRKVPKRATPKSLKTTTTV